ncbi:MAG TPA: hypothetical protein DEP69_06450 [Acidimicrobiaceae bacterium]|nr:hypothetical protein [Acidimicrobiaceae bacterium]
MEQLRSGATAAVGVRVVEDGRQGFASAGSLDDDVVAETLAAARDNLRFGEVDPDQKIAEPDGVASPGLDLSDDAVLAVPESEKIATAIELERRCRGADARITGVRVSAWSDSWGESALVSTAGIDIAERGGSCSIGCQPLAVDGDETQIGYGGDAARRPDQLDVDAVVAEAVADATGQLGAAKPASARLTVVLDPDVTAAFLGIVAGSLTGDRVLKGRSPFADRVGEQIAATSLTLHDDPTDPTTLGATNFDDEGLAGRVNVLVDAGVLTGFLHNCYTARRSGTRSTGSAVGGGGASPGVGMHAMVMSPGGAGGNGHDGQLDRAGRAGRATPARAGRATSARAGRADESVEQLLPSVGDGVLVRGVHGLHSGVNPVSGDFSVGAHGNHIRAGELAEPFREATVAGTLQRMLLDVVAVSARPKRLPGGMKMYAIAIGDVALSGS